MLSSQTRNTAILTALIAVLLFSTGGLYIKLLDIPPLPLTGLRSIIAAGFLAIYLAKTRKVSSLLAMTPIGWMAVVAYIIMITFFVTATKLTTAANAIFLQYTMPAWVLVGGLLWLKEKVTLNQVITILLCLVGMFLFFNDQLEPQEWQGNIIAILSGVALAVFILAVRRERDHDPLRSVFWGNLIAAVAVLPISFIIYPELFESLLSGKTLLYLLWLGIFQLGLAYVFYVNAIQRLPAIEVAIISLIEPVLNPIWVFLFAGESPSFWAILGGGMILISVLLHSVLTVTFKPAQVSEASE